MDGYIEKTINYKREPDVTVGQEIRKKACSNTNKYGLMKKNLQTQYALGNDQYLRTMSKVIDVLTNHSWDDSQKLVDKTKKEVKKVKEPEKETKSEGTSLMQKEKQEEKKKAQDVFFKTRDEHNALRDQIRSVRDSIKELTSISAEEKSELTPILDKKREETNQKLEVINEKIKKTMIKLSLRKK